jgi:serine/threonine-protein kinase
MLGIVFAADTATGNVIWTYPAPDATNGMGQIYASPIVSAGLLYITSSTAAGGSAVYALDAETGLLKWKYPGSFGYWISPVVYNGKVYVGDKNQLTVLDAVSGAVVWKLALGTQIVKSVCIVDINNKVYLPGDAGDVQ